MEPSIIRHSSGRADEVTSIIEMRRTCALGNEDTHSLLCKLDWTGSSGVLFSSEAGGKSYREEQKKNGLVGVISILIKTDTG